MRQLALSPAAGKHGTFGAVTSTLRSEAASEKLAEAGTGKPAVSAGQLSQTMAGFFRFLKANIDSNMTDSMVYAAQMLPAILPKDASPADVMPTLMKSAMAIDAARGVQWPAITPEQYQRGMKSSGYKGPRLNPKQEASIENFHRVYHEYLIT